MIFKFSSFMLNEKNCTLTRNHQVIEIEPKIFTLLCFFCRNAQRAVSRDELIEKVWQGRIVSNAAINRAVGELRKIIELDVKDPQYIVTISKVGYRFNAEIEVEKQETSTLINPKPTESVNSKKLTAPKAIIYLIAIACLLIILFTHFYYKPFYKSESQLYTSEALPLTTIKGSAFKQQVFTDGQMVFLHKDPQNKNVQLWLQTPHSPAKRLTQDNFYYTHAIFKDSNTIFATRFDNLTTRNCQVVKLTIATKQSALIANCATRALTHLAFDGESRKLYFNFRENVSQPYGIRSIQLDTGRIQQLTHANPKGNARGDYFFALSPSGNKMAVLEYQQNGGALLKVININAPLQIERHQHYYGVGGISWFDEKTLLITEQKGIIAYDLESTKSKYIINEEQITQAVFSPSLSLLSYVKFDTTKNIYQMLHPDLQHQEALTHSAYINILPYYANTSNSLVYFSTDSGKLDVQLLDKTGKKSILKFPEIIKHFGNLQWSSDDTSILASINSKLFHYSLKKHHWREIQTNLNNIHYVEAMNSDQVLVSSDQSGDWQLWQVDLNAIKTTQITKNGGYSAHYNASKNTVLLSKYSQEGLFELDLEDLTEIKIKDDFKITDWNKWQIRNNNLYSWENQSIVKLNLNTNIKSTVWQLKDANPAHFSINFDGSKLAYQITEQEKSTIWKRTVSLTPQRENKKRTEY